MRSKKTRSLLLKDWSIAFFARAVSLIFFLATASAVANDKVWEFIQMLGCTVVFWCASFHLNELKRPIRKISDLSIKSEVVTTSDFIEWLGFLFFLFGTAGRILT